MREFPEYTYRPVPTFLQYQEWLENRIKILEAELAASRAEHLKTQEHYTRMIRDYERDIRNVAEYLKERRSIKA